MIAATKNSKGVPQSASCLQHLRTTLRAALNLAVREGLLAANPVRGLELPSYRRPLARVWTDDRVAEWQETGVRPSVAVWTAVQLAAFLAAVADDSLYAMWWLIGLRGLRRMGRRRWTRHVEKVAALLAAALQADDVVLGGGQAKKLKKLPPGTRMGTNEFAIRGGLKLWDPKSSREA